MICYGKVEKTILIEKIKHHPFTKRRCRGCRKIMQAGYMRNEKFCWNCDDWRLKWRGDKPTSSLVKLTADFISLNNELYGKYEEYLPEDLVKEINDSFY